MKLQRRVLAGAVLASGLATMTSAQAEVWSASYSGGDGTASGTFTTSGPALVAEDILGISGVRNGVAITGLVPVGGDDDFLYDNQFTGGRPNLTDGGFPYGLTGDGFNSDVYFFEGDYDEVYVTLAGAVETPISWRVTAVPESATVPSMLAGLGLVGVYPRKPRAPAPGSTQAAEAAGRARGAAVPGRISVDFLRPNRCGVQPLKSAS